MRKSKFEYCYKLNFLNRDTETCTLGISVTIYGSMEIHVAIL